MQRASNSKAWVRPLRVMISDGRYNSTSAQQNVKPQKQHGDSEFVKRRRGYKKDLHKLRISFALEQAETKSRAEQARELDRKGLEGVAEARAMRKREKSIARQTEHLARLKAVQGKKRERTEYKRKDWEKRWNDVIEARVASVDSLAEHAAEWVTEQNVDEVVERVTDEFFVVAAKQKQELKETVG